MLPDSEIQAIVSLLDDPDADVQASVRKRLEELGREALPALRSVREEVDAETQARIDDVVHEVHVADVERAWHAVLSDDSVNLERGAFLLALYRFPTLDVPAYQSKLDGMAERLKPTLAGLHGLDRAAALASGVHSTLGFEGNREHYYDPNNSYLNRVIDRRLGIPISLSVITLCLARRLGVPMAGVNLPAHFLVKAGDGSDEVFLDPFNEGRLVPKEDIVRFLLKARIRPNPVHFKAAAPTDVLIRMVRNLLAIAKESGQTETVEELTRFIAPYDPRLADDAGTDDLPPADDASGGDGPNGGPDNGLDDASADDSPLDLPPFDA